MNIIDFLYLTKDMTPSQRSEYFNNVKDDELIENGLELERMLSNGSQNK